MKINVMLLFLFDTEKLEDTLKHKWVQMYDPSFIESVILKPLDARMEEPWFVDILKKISEKATGRKDSNILGGDDESQNSI